MKSPILPLALAALLCPAPAAAASRSFTVTDFDKVRVDGPYQVSLATRRAPFARVEGSTTAIESVVVEVQGRTLVIRPNRSAWGGYPGKPMGPIAIVAGTHELSAAVVNGAGSLAIDRVSGLSFAATAQGAGSLSIAEVRSDRINVGLVGAASARLGGKVLSLTATVRGSSLLDAQALGAKDAVLGMEGPGEIRATVSNVVAISANGPGRITLGGRPACTVRGTATGSITGCR
jgi:hypothetical protein